MSYTYLVESGEESLAESFSEIPAYVLSRLNLTAEKSYCSDSATESFQSSQYGTTSEPLTENRGEEELTLFAEDSHAKTSALQEKVKGLKANNQDYGRRCGEWFAKLDPNASLWKIRQLSLFEDSEPSLEIWPRWGIMQNGECFHAEKWVECICENASSFSVPTPRSCTAMQARITENTAKAKFPNLETVIAKLMLPTLGKNENKGAASKRFIGSPDFHGTKMSEGLRTCETDPTYLSPSFAELVMMWPLGWTDLQPLEMGKFQEWLRLHGKH